jgi:hypothetical protein
MINFKTDTYKRDNGVLHLTTAKVEKAEFLKYLVALGMPTVEGFSWTVRDDGKNIVVTSNGFVPESSDLASEDDEDLESDC